MKENFTEEIRHGRNKIGRFISDRYKTIFTRNQLGVSKENPLERESAPSRKRGMAEKREFERMREREKERTSEKASGKVVGDWTLEGPWQTCRRDRRKKETGGWVDGDVPR